MSKLPRHILVIRLSAMGDVAMVVPVLRALHLQYPEVKITVLTRAFFAPFFKDLPNVSVFAAELKGKHKGFLGLYKLSQELKTQDMEAIADIHHVLRTNVLKGFLSGYTWVQLNKGRKEKKALTSGKIVTQLKTTHERYADVFEQLGLPINLSHPTFPKRAKLNQKLQGIVPNSQLKIVGIAPFAAHQGKMYPLDMMKRVIEELSKNYKVILFGGGEKESNVLNNIETQYKNVQSIAGKLSLEEELDVISNLDIMLSMDSANAHMAAMFGVKVVTIWGVTHPYAGFTPFNQPEDYALLSDRKQFPKIPTSVYGNKYPENYKEASRSIPADEVIRKIKQII